MEQFKKKLPGLIRKREEEREKSRRLLFLKKGLKKFLTNLLGKSSEERNKRRAKRVKKEGIEFLVTLTALSREEVEEISNELVRKILKKRRQKKKQEARV